jgi:predicted 2-oxoglutarate/Fe(II)-dependent dioxygenase YbiX
MNNTFVKDKVIPEYLLQDIIYDFNNIAGRNSDIISNNERKIDKSFRSSISKVVDSKTYPDLNNILTSFCSSLDKKHLPSKLILKEMEYLKYGPTDHFKKHNDVISDKNPKRIRRFSTVTLLSKTEDLEGGNLIIFDKYDSKLEANLEVGETVLFYSSTFHKVTPITKGGREVLVGWIYDL